MKLVCREVVRRQLAAEVNSSTSQLAALSIASGVVFCCGLRLKNLTGALDALWRHASSTARLQLAYGFDVTTYS